MKYVIGIDGGGTKTHAILLDELGNIHATASGSTANYHSEGFQKTIHTLHDLIQKLVLEASLQLKDIYQITGCLAGIDSEQEAELMETELAKLLGKEVSIKNDGLAALYSVNGTGEGAILVAGTGSVAIGKDANGRIFRIGGWGHLVGDQGSGFDIGKRAIYAVLAAAEHIGKSTMLEQAIAKYLQIENADQLISWASAYDRYPRDLAALVPIVVQAAEAGDQVAIDILRQAAKDLGTLGNHILDQGIWKQKQLSLVGGLEHIWQWIGKPLIQHVADRHGNVLWVKPLYSPVVGAALLAFDQNGIRLTSDLQHLHGFSVNFRGEDD